MIKKTLPFLLLIFAFSCTKNVKKDTRPIKSDIKNVSIKKPGLNGNQTTEDTNSGEIIKTNKQLKNAEFLVVIQNKNKIVLVNKELKVIKQYESGEFINSGTWSKKSKRAVFLTTDNENKTISAVSFDKELYLKITGKYLSKPVISPQGNFFYFTEIKDNTFTLNSVDMESQERKTIFSSNLENIAPEKIISKAVPVISQDSKYVVFPFYTGENFNLFIYDKENRKTVQITKGNDDNYSANFSPDSKRIVYVSKRENAQIFTIRVDGRGRKRLTFSQDNKTNPVFSPNGKKIAFISQYKTRNRIQIMDKNGDNVRVLKSLYRRIHYCRFINENTILFKTVSGVYKINVTTRKLNTLLKNSYSFINPSE